MNNKNLNQIKEDTIEILNTYFNGIDITINDDFEYNSFDALLIESSETNEVILIVDGEDGFIDFVVYEDNKLKKSITSNGFELSENNDFHEQIRDSLEFAYEKLIFDKKDNELNI